jgi:hypothetical protein
MGVNSFGKGMNCRYVICSLLNFPGISVCFGKYDKTHEIYLPLIPHNVKS